MRASCIVGLRLLDYAHIIHKSLIVRTELLKDAVGELYTMTVPIAGCDASLIRFLK